MPIRRPAFSGFVGVIDVLIAEKKMIRIHAQRHVAPMAHMHAFRDFTDEKLKSNAVRACGFPAG
jgi:hypothetical protein